jgi:hypothetical protein
MPQVEATSSTDDPERARYRVGTITTEEAPRGTAGISSTGTYRERGRAAAALEAAGARTPWRSSWPAEPSIRRSPPNRVRRLRPRGWRENRLGADAEHRRTERVPFATMSHRRTPNR